jgi:hypothetical protein
VADYVTISRYPMGVNEEEWIEEMKQTNAPFEEKDERKIEVNLEMDYYSNCCSFFINFMMFHSLLIDVLSILSSLM